MCAVRWHLMERTYFLVIQKISNQVSVESEMKKVLNKFAAVALVLRSNGHQIIKLNDRLTLMTL